MIRDYMLDAWTENVDHFRYQLYICAIFHFLAIWTSASTIFVDDFPGNVLDAR